ncbi:hypothetical protein ATO6_02020 [Oceanicola sp. 22II-s10i]|nr:hypothetical protein ATO6_02020 [Oceanicola sp. 22II-s10i]
MGRTEQARDRVSLEQVRRLATILDFDPGLFSDGDVLPLGWHVVLFPPMAAIGSLGRDGHPPKGSFLPDLGLPRRMFAGRRVEFHAPLRIGETTERHSRIADVSFREGRTGHMAFVTITHDLVGAGGSSLTETQTVVYREAATKGKAAPEKAAGKQTSSQQQEQPEFKVHQVVTPSPMHLFRYSAVTFNAHRIHYDAPYAREVEGYPGLVVNGGLTVLWLTELAKTLRNGPVASAEFSNRKALHVDRPIRLESRPAPGDPRTIDVRAVDDTGATATEGRLTWASE